MRIGPCCDMVSVFKGLPVLPEHGVGHLMISLEMSLPTLWANRLQWIYLD